MRAVSHGTDTEKSFDGVIDTCVDRLERTAGSQPSLTLNQDEESDE